MSAAQWRIGAPQRRIGAAQGRIGAKSKGLPGRSSVSTPTLSPSAPSSPRAGPPYTPDAHLSVSAPASLQRPKPPPHFYAHAAPFSRHQQPRPHSLHLFLAPVQGRQSLSSLHNGTRGEGPGQARGREGKGGRERRRDGRRERERQRERQRGAQSERAREREWGAEKGRKEEKERQREGVSDLAVLELVLGLGGRLRAAETQSAAEHTHTHTDIPHYPSTGLRIADTQASILVPGFPQRAYRQLYLGPRLRIAHTGAAAGCTCYFAERA
eukprot:3124740-Rhodomonas_salina.1